MTNNVFISGFGGQGVLLIGNLLAYAGIIEGKNVSYFPSYGVEKRGGAANCTIVISDIDVGSPVIGHPEAGLFLNQTAYDKYLSMLKPGAFCLVNTSLVQEKEGIDGDYDFLRVPLNEEAHEIGDARLSNMITLGAYVAKTGAVSLDSLKEGLKLVLPERNHRFIPMNVKALERGASLALQGNL